MKPAVIEDTINGFEKDPTAILICSIDFSESFSITTCQNAYMLGNTYMPDTYKQATDRIRRASTIHKRVTIHNLICKDSVDELVNGIRLGYAQSIRKALGKDKKKII